MYPISMKRIVPFVLSASLLLSGCGAPKIVEAPAKLPFFVETITAQSLTQRPELLKTGKITAGQEIVISSQVAGRVRSITPKLWTEVTTNQLLLQLDDTNWAYTFAVKRAWTALEQARISYDATVLGIEKSLADSSLALRQAQVQRESADGQNSDSATQRQLDQVDAELNKANFDYATKLESDTQTINNYFTTARSITDDIRILRENILNECDKILGMSDLYKYTNDTFEQLLGARNTSTLRDAKAAYRQTELQAIPQLSSQDPDELVPHLQNLKSALTPATTLIESMQTMLDYTETSDQFSSASLLAMQATIDGLLASLQAQRSSLNAQANAMESFLATYQQAQASLAQSISIAEQQRALLERNLQDAQARAEIWLEWAENSATTTQKTKQTTLASLQNSIAQASVSYQEAQHQISKLSIEAPISWVVKEIFVDVWQEVTPGTPLIALSNNSNPEVRISLSEEELPYISLWKVVSIRTQGEIREWTVVSYAKTTDAALRYEVVISLNQAVDLLGELVEVVIPFETTTPLLPLNSITLINDDKWLVTLVQWTGLTQEIVEVGKLWWDMIEIITPLNPQWVIVISDASTFDPVRFELEIQ